MSLRVAVTVALRGALIAAFAAVSISASAQQFQSQSQYEDALKAALGECDTTRGTCLNACASKTACDDCEKTWRACRAALLPNVDVAPVPPAEHGSGSTQSGGQGGSGVGGGQQQSGGPNGGTGANTEFCGGKKIGLTECCVDGMVVAATPVTKKKLSSGKCEQRKSNGRGKADGGGHELDGCSVPAALEGFLPGGDRQDPAGGFLGEHGRGGTRFGRKQGDKDDPVGHLIAGELVEHLPCNDHDMCYQSCDKPQKQCDDQMYSAMNAVCEREYPSGGCPERVRGAGGVLLCADWYEERATCAKEALQYYVGLRMFGYTFAWADRQADFCSCCG